MPSVARDPWDGDDGRTHCAPTVEERLAAIERRLAALEEQSRQVGPNTVFGPRPRPFFSDRGKDEFEALLPELEALLEMHGRTV